MKAQQSLLVGITAVGAYSDPFVQEGVAPAEAEGEVIARAQGHDRHSWGRLQLQLPHRLQNPCDGAIPACCQYAQPTATWETWHGSTCTGLVCHKSEASQDTMKRKRKVRRHDGSLRAQKQPETHRV